MFIRIREAQKSNVRNSEWRSGVLILMGSENHGCVEGVDEKGCKRRVEQPSRLAER